jgi:hypothetical protein
MGLEGREACNRGHEPFLLPALMFPDNLPVHYEAMPL